jgi:hypothetical protein
MDKIIKFVIILVVLILLGLWSPWSSFNFNISKLFGVEEAEKISGLQVYTARGTIEVFIDQESQGTTSPEEDAVIVDTVEPGERLVTIKRVSEIEDAYYEFSKLINFVEGVDVVITYSLGPDKIFSEGSIISARAKQGENYNLEVLTNISDFNVELDGIDYISTESRFTGEISLDRQHIVKVQKNGYEPVQLTLLPEDQGSRDRLSNYVMQVDLNLMLQPVKVE